MTIFGQDSIGKIRRGLHKPPLIILRRLAAEIRGEADRWLAPRRGRLNSEELLCRTQAQSLEALWDKLAARPYPAVTKASQLSGLEETCPGTRDRILARAQAAIDRRIDLLGSEELTLTKPIDWQKDHKSAFRWEPAYFRDIDYNNPDQPSDVKMAWELSRLQWAMPLGQAWLLTGDARYPTAARQLIEEWIDDNPYAGSVNWACTMEVALRIFVWTWFFHVFHNAPSWADTVFRTHFLTTLFLHAEFTERYIERSDVNGNHFTADAAGLVMAGLFFGEGSEAVRWASSGWRELERELPLQVPPDGADFEASTAYHRLVTELFLLPARYRQVCGESVAPEYAERLGAMARFIAAYTRPDGTCPLWGDADDARALPFGTQPLNDHRYLVGMVGLSFADESIISLAGGLLEEAFWWFGVTAQKLGEQAREYLPSCAFMDAGVFVMRSASDQIFIDCGPIGLAGRGGHGHNDCLAFEAVLDGVPLVSDCGAYLYTASYTERNAFRSTAYHNTPQVDGQEINRFIRPDYLWNLHYDAKPEVIAWASSELTDTFVGSHQGYLRLYKPVRPIRSLVLDHSAHALTVIDLFEGVGEHALNIPYHFAPGVSVRERGPGSLEIESKGRRFLCLWSSAEEWTLTLESARVSPSYGRARPCVRLAWTRTTGPLKSLRVTFMPEEADAMSVAERANLVLTQQRNK